MRLRPRCIYPTRVLYGWKESSGQREECRSQPRSDRELALGGALLCHTVDTALILSCTPCLGRRWRPKRGTGDKRRRYAEGSGLDVNKFESINEYMAYRNT